MRTHIYTFTKKGLGSDLFDMIKFVAKARSRSEGQRWGLSLLQVETGRICSTDGRRIHVFESPDLDIEPGFYRFVHQTPSKFLIYMMDKDAQPFPKVDGVLSIIDHGMKGGNGELFRFGKPQKDSNLSLEFFKFFKWADMTVDLSFLKDAGDARFFLNDNMPKKGIAFVSAHDERMRGVIMPFYPT